MDCSVKPEILETLQPLATIKTEALDYSLEQIEENPHFYDEIEVGEEFKTEPPPNEVTSECFPRISESCSQDFNELSIRVELKSEWATHVKQSTDQFPKNLDKIWKLVHCLSCNKSWKYAAGKGSSCLKCKSDLKYKCGKCMRFYKSNNSSQQHLHTYCNNKKTKFCCDHCKYETYAKYNLYRHVKRNHLPRDPNLNQCSNCGKIYSRRSNLLKHSKICGKTEDAKRLSVLFFCDHCEYKTYHKQHLSQHIQAKHLPRDPNLNKCKKCGKNFSQRSNLLTHSKICGLTKEAKCSMMSLSCDHCNYETNKKSHLYTHIQAKHLPQDQNLNKCKKCGKSFSQRSNLLTHSKICGKTKGTKRSLMRFCCDHCSYQTYHKQHLSDHIQAKHLPRDSNLNKCT